jgi:hypothetical protein
MSMMKLDDSKAEPGSTAAKSDEGSLTSGAIEGALALSDQPVTREQRRSRRKRAVRARTISVKRMTKRELEMGRVLFPETDYTKPRTRSECADGPRPCPYVSCKYHLYLDVQTRTGAIKLNFPDIEVEDMVESCSLDIADRGGTTLEEVGAIMNLTRERIRQLEVRAMAKVKSLNEMEALRDFVDEGPVGKRRLPVLSATPDDSEEFDEHNGAEDIDDDLPLEANDCETVDSIEDLATSPTPGPRPALRSAGSVRFWPPSGDRRLGVGSRVETRRLNMCFSASMG